jgi:hypothetical protein
MSAWYDTADAEKSKTCSVEEMKKQNKKAEADGGTHEC